MTIPLAPAQSLGSRGGEADPRLAVSAGRPDHHAVENYITVTGTAEVRVKPTRIRVVLAVNSHDPDPARCQRLNHERRDALVQALEGAGVARDRIHVDFISMLPTYRWQVEAREGRSTAVETLADYRMQTNLHLVVPTESAAQRAIGEAFKLGIADVIAFDHWAEDLDRVKAEARRKAVQAARDKADLLLALFEKKPRPINVDEDTRVIYPAALYASFENTYSQSYEAGYGHDVPRIRAWKPKNTYYRGFLDEVDAGGSGLPVGPEISVVSTVRFYYASPFARAVRKHEGESGRE